MATPFGPRAIRLWRFASPHFPVTSQEADGFVVTVGNRAWAYRM